MVSYLPRVGASDLCLEKGVATSDLRRRSRSRPDVGVSEVPSWEDGRGRDPRVHEEPNTGGTRSEVETEVYPKENRKLEET